MAPLVGLENKERDRRLREIEAFRTKVEVLNLDAWLFSRLIALIVGDFKINLK
jgi:hypothetical protein